MEKQIDLKIDFSTNSTNGILNHNMIYKVIDNLQEEIKRKNNQKQITLNMENDMYQSILYLSNEIGCSVPDLIREILKLNKGSK